MNRVTPYAEAELRHINVVPIPVAHATPRLE